MDKLFGEMAQYSYLVNTDIVLVEVERCNKNYCHPRSFFISILL